MNNRKKNKFRYLVWIILLFVIVHFILKFITNSVSSISQKYQKAVTPQYNNEELKQVVDTSLKNSKGSYAIAIHNLKTGQEYRLNEHRIFNTASLYKVWVMTIVTNQLQNNLLKHDQVLTEDVKVLNEFFDIPEESAQQTTGTISYSVEDALDKMITISDNNSSLLLTEKITRAAVRNFLKDAQLEESVGGEKGKLPKTTASDMNLFFEKLYKGQLADASHTNDMIALLKRQQLNDVIPKYLPNTISIAHKTGEIDEFAHDAGIIYTPFGDYIFIGLSESGSPPDAEDRLARVSEAVYNYFKQDNEQKIKEVEMGKKEIREKIIVISLLSVSAIIVVIIVFFKLRKKQD